MEVPKNYYKISPFTSVEAEKLDRWVTKHRNHLEKLKIFKSDPLNEDVSDEEVMALFEIYLIPLSVAEAWELLKKSRQAIWITIAIFEMDDAGLLDKSMDENGKIRYKIIDDRDKVKRWMAKNNVKMPENP